MTSIQVPRRSQRRLIPRLAAAVLFVMVAIPFGVVAEAASSVVTGFSGVQKGQILKGTVAIEAHVTGSSISQVVFQLSGPQTRSHTEQTAPYFFLGNTNGTPTGWNTTQSPDGEYTLTASATDRAGAGGSRLVRFRVGNRTPPAPAATAIPPAMMGGSAFRPVRINSGSSAYTGGDGRVWAADGGFSGGSTYAGGTAIGGTTDEPLFQKERYGTFSYAFPMPSGSYRVTLKFAELYWTAVGRRVFDVALEGTVVLNNFDILTEVAPYTALDKSFVVDVGDGTLNLEFSRVSDNASVAAIEVMAAATAVPTPAPVPSATTTPAGTADVTVSIDRASQTGVSLLAMGVTHTHHSADPWDNAAAVASARQLLQASSVYQNQHIMGWGADNPQPSPGVYNWGSLDRRIDLIRQTGGVPVITLCCAPDWMKGGPAGSTDWSKLEAAPTTDHFADFAELSRQVALRYPDVKHFQVWNELKGFYNSSVNRWDYERYTTMYNMVYDAVKSVRPDAKLGGPYVVMDSWLNRSFMSHPSSISGPYGTLDQRALDVITYWLANKRGAEFIAVDAWAGNKDTGVVANDFASTQKFRDVANWIRQQPNGGAALPIWWAEWYPTPWGATNYGHDHQNAVLATTLVHMIESGAAMQLRWQPQGETAMSFQGNTESLWSDAAVAGGGQPFPYYHTQKAIKEHFAPGTTLYKTLTSSPEVEMLASATRTLLINQRPTTVTVSVDGSRITMAGYEVRVL